MLAYCLCIVDRESSPKYRIFAANGVNVNRHTLVRLILLPFWPLKYDTWSLKEFYASNL